MALSAEEADRCQQCHRWRITEKRYRMQGPRPIGDFVG